MEIRAPDSAAHGSKNCHPFRSTTIFRCADVPLGDQTVDTAVTTWVMCSIVNLRQMLREMKRVLKRDGQLLFIEHGLSPDPRVQKWQNRIAPICSRLSGAGCLHQRKDSVNLQS